ncbi:hypothetical protein EO763_02510 [Pectobacterium odoriferum]|uniref:hypothetical protein n=1 Tax=Pectobacterium odoriferum TaxID=78398 RepID=UPI0013746CC8|nr:hypothetical protein [Pectobacterium odoriferum]QHP78921.1 hypothetical protein EO763_02510 [Pectobacterium odoriferum]GKW03233.1 hypothetical protein PEC301877_20460 [Pectobacterium carotovorum subsp. carotovorum]GKX42233.1 hypothetical protein SOASR015_12670 [Pectobacterium carotovorum subsp. carotovorum]GLX55588.1 hypothetical protein Pcaca02_08970 [Pectobacterium carotovorum subsp. carotovorum]
MVDEQDANSEEILKNLYLYAFSDFLMVFSEGKASLEAAESSIIDVYDYMAAQPNFYSTRRKEKRSF